MTLFWNRKNEPIEDTLEWARLYEDNSYRTVAVDVDDTHDMHVMVSTIWEGVDRMHNIYPTPETVMIFETAVLFDGMVDQAWLANNEEDALANHKEACRMFLARDPDPDSGLREQLAGGS